MKKLIIIIVLLVLTGCATVQTVDVSQDIMLSEHAIQLDEGWLDFIYGWIITIIFWK